MNTQKHKVLKDHTYQEHPRVLFFLCCLSFFIGVFYGSDGVNTYSDVLLLLFPILLIILIGIKSVIRIVIILAISIVGYILSSSVYEDYMRDINSLWWVIWEKLYITGTIEKKLYKTEFNQAYKLSFDNFASISPHHVDITKIKSHLLLEIPENLSLNIWDTITFTGKIQSLYKWSLDGFEKYTFYNHLSWKVSASTFTRNTEWKPWILQKFSQKMEKHIFHWFPRDVAGIILGMTIWRVELMGKSIQESFRTSGISHILVVSGSNITFLIVLIGWLLQYLPIGRYVRITIICIFVLIYSTLVGWDIPVLRSTIMGLLGYYAIEHSSRLSSIAILLCVGVGFLIYSPLSLVYDPAFWLSFVATMSIILYYKRLYIIFQWYGLPLWIGSIIAISLAATLGTTPVTLYHFGWVALWGIFANIAIAWVVWWILFFSVWYMLLWFLGQWLLYILWYSVYIPILYIIHVAGFFWQWPMIEPWKNISSIIILIFFAVFLLEVFKFDPLWGQIKDDHQ